MRLGEESSNATRLRAELLGARGPLGRYLLYLRPYDGWGAWAAAPLLLPSILLSVVEGAFGLVLLGRALLRRQPVDWTILAATLLSGGPALYYTLRHLWRSAG